MKQLPAQNKLLVLLQPLDIENMPYQVIKAVKTGEYLILLVDSQDDDCNPDVPGSLTGHYLASL